MSCAVCNSHACSGRSTHAYENVAHYRRCFDAAGVHPGDLRHLEDLQRFPLLTKHDLRDNYPFGMFAVPRER